MKNAFLFPGQGSQHIGMGKELYESFKIYRETIELAEDTLSMHIKKLMFDGPEIKLTATQNAQPILLTSSYATLLVLKEAVENINVNFVLGHSLGEYSALLCAKAFSFKDALKITRFRGKAMQNAPKGIMSAVIGMSYEKLNKILVDGCFIANDNCEGQIIISGLSESVEIVSKKAKENGAKLVIKLNVSGPFHTPLMSECAEKMQDFLKDIRINDLKYPYYPNVLAKPNQDKNRVKELLIKQITGRVRFRESILDMINNEKVTNFYEIGPKKVLSGIVKKINPDVSIISINSPYQLGVE